MDVYGSTGCVCVRCCDAVVDCGVFFAVFLSPALSLDMQSPSTEGLLYYLCDLCVSVFLCACVLTLVTSSVCAAASPEQRPVRRSSRRQSAQRRTETSGDASAPETGG